MVNLNPVLNPLKNTIDFVAESDAPVIQDGGHPLPPLLARKITDVEQEAIRGPGFTPADLPAYINAVKTLNGPGLDDRKFLLEKVLTLMARAPDDSAFAATLQKFAIDILYKDLPHPPSGYLALPSGAPPTASPITKGVKYAYRSADGSDYNVLIPTLGMAGTPYARSVPSTTRIPPQYLPDPGLVFDTLLKREKFVEHPGGISSLFFAFADLVIHSIFNTNTRDWTINDASSYLDLSPLYGSSQAQVDSVRRKDGTGRLYEDVFADPRLLFMPPASCALLVLFCRNHNYVAERILAINELGSYRAPSTLGAQERAAQDEELFQRARLVNSALFMQVILGDYVGAILGLTRDGLAWRLDPLAAMRELNHAFAPQGEGNVVAVEFNLMYRWHATSSASDTQWIENLFGELFPGKSWSDISVNDFRTAIIKYVMGTPQDVKEWSFDNLKRGPDGRYNDVELANILQSATEAPASAFGARGTPEVLRVIEILGIMQARSWGTCSLNEFRSFMGLKPYSTFAEWNPDPKIYAGLQAEETKVPMPGAGLCPGYTISRAILADAVCLTRGDRFLTVDLTPFNLTTWGYQDCQYKKDDGSIGGILSKLLFRTLPNQYPADSAYAFFPFMVPKTMKGHVAADAVNKYSWDRPALAAPVTSLLGPSVSAPVSEYDQRLKAILGGVVPDRAAVRQVLFSDASIQQWAQSFQEITQQLLKTKSVDHVDSKAKYVNIVRNVINVLPIVWISNFIVGLPLKTETNPHGVYREHDLLTKWSDIGNYVFLDQSPEGQFALRGKCTETAKDVTGFVKGHCAELSGHSLSGFADSVVDYVTGGNEHERSFMKSLLAGRHGSHDALAAGVIAEVVATAPLYSRILAEVVDYYLDDGKRARLVSVLTGESANRDEKLLALIREALRKGDVQKLDAARSVDFGLLDHRFLAKTAFTVLRTIFALKDLKRAPGSSGSLNRFADDTNGELRPVYLTSQGSVTPWPVSMLVQVGFTH
ncbi:hypothetical protein IEO21_07443 [Rhodonia placenta]|uniref:Heme peroxidase n=1 Tax=Rhodonia placenta TaxID=104341 RepID=A0A8H7NY10_9APHY|nr:hypothetical protein IEO21_07443 [Postia placenta]